MKIEEKSVEMALWVTGNEQDFDRLRLLSYCNSHVIVICFAVDDPDSFDNVREKVDPSFTKVLK
jgi:Ras homolog gene family, member A